eukprot:NODE_128_length_2006_cov_280.320349.p2 GENE.NODE_128_length_2006_cov_280.320349~~NODE_128_length_2006_cov_280.320349.p2  ORF type:complete len:551 (-),score=189.21 NODE_128_length_2006_cov_280.320349:308-1960(-)
MKEAHRSSQYEHADFTFANPGDIHTTFANPGDIHTFYHIPTDMTTLGKGGFGLVRRCEQKRTGNHRAVKLISVAEWKQAAGLAPPPGGLMRLVQVQPQANPQKKKIALRLLERLVNEVEIMKNMDHPNIIKLYETFEDQDHSYFVMELCEGGDLFDEIHKVKAFTEQTAAAVMKQIFSGVHYMHTQCVCHRDLKPEHFLFVTKDPIEQNILKIVNFGSAYDFTCGKIPNPEMGSRDYMSPEQHDFTGFFNNAVDLWACGVVLYILLAGRLPFTPNHRLPEPARTSAFVRDVRSAEPSFKASEWQDVPEDAKDLVRQLLAKDPDDRYTAKQALDHEWVAKLAPRATGKMLQSVFERLQEFRMYNRLQKAILHVIASQLGPEHVRKLQSVFEALDVGGEGFLTLAELENGLKESGIDACLSDTAVSDILAGIDTDGSGRIDYTEFIAASLDKDTFLREGYYRSAFQVFDRDGDGVISPEDMKQVLGDDPGSGESVEELFRQADADGDGTLSFDEFITILQSKKTRGARAEVMCMRSQTLGGSSDAASPRPWQ